MSSESVKKRLRRDRPMTSVTLRMPEDVVDDLKRLAPRLGFSGYQPLIRAYVGDGMRRDLARFESDTVTNFVASLKRRGVSEELIEAALSDAIEQ